ncbi:MAG: hypothetical protein JNJ54_08940 [Myxococcaceae bacterium]|nr:hypothetical protein [Myxococcaceae bacterium]
MTKRRVLGVIGLLLIGAFAFASSDRCGDWPSAPPTLTMVSRGTGALAVGAAQVRVLLPGPVTVGGYGPLRRSSASGDPVFARATLLEVGGQRLALVSLDVLLLTRPLVTAIRAGSDFPVLVTATHTHSSVGQYDRRLAAQVAALGTFDERVEQALVTAARAALAGAQQQVVPVSMQVRRFETAAFVQARSGDAVDPRGLELAFVKPDGARHARWLLLGAHPTLSPRRTAALDTDWPGLVAQGEGVTLVLQTSVGNASVNRAVAPDEQAVVQQLAAALDRGARVDGCEDPGLSFASAQLALPHPDGSRLAPWPFRAAAENALCAAEEMEAEVSMLRLGCVSLLLTPVEPTFAAAQQLERLTGATHVLALSNGYVGYLEPPDVVRARLGEAKRQWFGPELFESVSPAALLVAMGSDPAQGRPDRRSPSDAGE